METISNDKFDIDTYFDFTIIDEYGNRWDEDFEPVEVCIGISSNDKSCSLVEVKIEEFEDLEKWKLIQVAENSTEEEVRSFLIDIHEELKTILSEKLNDSELNGQC